MAKPNAVDRASSAYFDSTEDDEDKESQQEMFNDELSNLADILEKLAGSNKYEIKVVATIKPVADNALPDNIPILRGKMGKEYVEEMIEISINSEAFKKRLRAIVGEPSGTLRKDLEEARAEKGQ